MTSTLLVPFSVSILFDLGAEFGAADNSILWEMPLSLDIHYSTFSLLSFFLISHFSVSFGDSSFSPQILEYPRIQFLDILFSSYIQPIDDLVQS